MAGGPAATSGAIAFDCPDPESLARFYAELLGVDLDGAEAHALTLGAERAEPQPEPDRGESCSTRWGTRSA